MFLLIVVHCEKNVQYFVIMNSAEDFEKRMLMIDIQSGKQLI